MNALTLWKASTLTLAGALAFTLWNPVKEAEAEPQPHMKAALASLVAAHDQLDKASSDKGGHRVAAKKLTASAIEEVKKGIAHDEKNSTDGSDAEPSE
ncbi:MAG: hypothetical protein IPG04_05545 [Polyangiaceae bacterium]|jgi:hypothetical protein|nr:hypothetical protein [Polyangiaceae bacterium]